MTVENLDTYVHKDPQLPIMLDRLVFIVNTDRLMLVFIVNTDRLICYWENQESLNLADAVLST